jgi:hypothetical protein
MATDSSLLNYIPKKNRSYVAWALIILLIGGGIYKIFFSEKTTENNVENSIVLSGNGDVKFDNSTHTTVIDTPKKESNTQNFSDITVEGGAAAQFGNNNKQTNNFGQKPRENTDEVVKEVKSRLKDKSFRIIIYIRSQDVESENYRDMIIKDLIANKYTYIQKGGVFNDDIVGGDSKEELKRKTHLYFYKRDANPLNSETLEIYIPSNQ